MSITETTMIQTAETKMIRPMYGHFRKVRKKYMMKSSVGPIKDKMRESRLSWSAHMKQRPSDTPVMRWDQGFGLVCGCCRMQLFLIDFRSMYTRNGDIFPSSATGSKNLQSTYSECGPVLSRETRRRKIDRIRRSYIDIMGPMPIKTEPISIPKFSRDSLLKNPEMHKRRLPSSNQPMIINDSLSHLSQPQRRLGNKTSVKQFKGTKTLNSKKGSHSSTPKPQNRPQTRNATGPRPHRRDRSVGGRQI